MNKRVFFVFFSIFSIFYISNLSAQQYRVGITITGLSIHPRGANNAHLQRFGLDKRGVFVFNPGIAFSFEYFLFRDIFSIKFVQALYVDCAAQLGGFTHIGMRHKIFNNEVHSLYGGLGPTFIFRRSWHRLDGYMDELEVFFRGGPEHNWQWRFIWFGGELEYNYSINDEIDLSLMVVPAVPFNIFLAPGIRMNQE
ncbi:MAG: hypothetical protein FWC36_07295 [Spirochaetes bacterium]|nr:hypothetical protein [Spirochaetota bacterium]